MAAPSGIASMSFIRRAANSDFSKSRPPEKAEAVKKNTRERAKIVLIFFIRYLLFSYIFLPLAAGDRSLLNSDAFLIIAE
jgi:hypothetical protein